MSPSVLVIDVNQIEMEMTKDIKNTVFSPQFNISFKILNSEGKNSTPLYDEKENLPVIAVFESNEISTYTTPEVIQNSSLIVISAMKKSSTPLDGIMKSNSKVKPSGRRVTFEKIESPESPELEVSVYSSPTASEIIEETKSNWEDANCSIEPRGCTITDMVKSLKLAFHGIPRSLWNAYDWSLRIIRNRNDDHLSPRKKRKRGNDEDRSELLKRRPISSYWMKMSVSSLVRDPLPTYVEKYSCAPSNKNV